MPINRILITEQDERSHTTVIGAIECLFHEAKKYKKHLYLITAKRDTCLVRALKKIPSINELLKYSKDNPNSILRWETLSSRFFINDSSIVLCPYLSLPDIEVIDSQMPNNADMIVIEVFKGDCQAWYDRWHNCYLNGSLWSDELPEILYKGLAFLTSTINVVNPHDLDDDRIKTAIRVINKYLPNASSSKIKDVLINDFHWRLDYAKQFIERLEGLKQGKIFRGGDTSGLKHIFDMWDSYSLQTKK